MENVAMFIREGEQLEILNVQAVGVTFGGASVCGWAELGADMADKGVIFESEPPRIYFGPLHEVILVGLRQETRVDRRVLDTLADLLEQESRTKPSELVQENAEDPEAASNHQNTVAAIG